MDTRKAKIEEYYSALNGIEDKLGELDGKTVNQLLDQIFAIKPVRLKWYLVKAKLMLKEKKSVDEIVEFLSDKCAPWYIYDGVEEYFQFLSILSECNGDIMESKRYLYYLERLKEHSGIVSRGRDETAEEIKTLGETILKADSLQFMEKEVEKLKELYYIRGNLYVYLLWEMVGRKFYKWEKGKEGKWIREKLNVEYYCERLKSKNEEIFVVIMASKKDETDCYLAARGLRELGKKVFLLKAPVIWNKGREFTQAAKASIESLKTEKGLITANVYFIEGENKDTRGALLEHIVKNYHQEELATILGKGLLLDQMTASKDMKTRMERLTEVDGDHMEQNIAVGRYGDYLSYIANIYKTSKKEIDKELNKKPSCRFSLIIPCKNGIHTLQGTLQTCLHQSYKGDYEIIVSDNWDLEWEGETPIYKICKSFHDDRIKYLRVPRNLYLTRNFEYAFLKARGEFLISMGADDGILPWALEELDQVLTKYPHKFIFTWREVFYKWPDVVGKYTKYTDNYRLKGFLDFQAGRQEVVTYPAKNMFLGCCFEDRDYICYLPQLYHNSGIRREYLSILYKKTGVLWAGVSQDICMAVTIGNIEEELSFINTPLTIAGVSNESVGCQNSIGNEKYWEKTLEKKLKNTFGQGVRIQGFMERFCPVGLGKFISSLFACVMYGHAIGSISDEIIELIDWKMIYLQIGKELDQWDSLYDKKVHRLRYAVSMLGEEVIEWFDKNFYNNILEPCLIKDSEIVGDLEENSKNNIEVNGKAEKVKEDDICDIYKAVLLIERWMNEKGEKTVQKESEDRDG